MAYQLLPFRQSPNYTPASQTRAIYGRDPSRNEGAGHWWDDPARFPSFNGVVATLMNPARQASAHDVVGDGVVQPLVRKADTSWCTGNANPFTYSIETDPQIIYRWRAGGDKAKANRIFETLCERIADVSMHDKVWRPHKYWQPSTVCNPIEWADVMRRAKEVWQQKYGAPPKPSIKWIPMDVPRKLIANADLRIIDVSTGKTVGDVIRKDTVIDFQTKAVVNGVQYVRSVYSTSKGLNHGIDFAKLREVPVPVPEWQKNLVDIADVKLTVLAAQTPVVDLNSGATIKQLGQGTVLDIAKKTTVKGVEYAITSYSATNAMPNGIKFADIGVPAKPPVNEKPEWLKNWRDIEDVDMYTRADTDLVNLDDGSTVKVIPRGTKVAISSTTEWHGHKYAITVYSTDKKEGRGIRIDDLDMKPVGDDTPLEPSPEQPTIEDNVNWLVKAIKAILAFFKINV